MLSSYTPSLKWKYRHFDEMCITLFINAITGNAMKHQRGLLPFSLVCLENDKMKGKELHVIYGIVQAAIASSFEQPQVNVFSMGIRSTHCYH